MKRDTASEHYIPGLDGLRAISITLVVLGHLGFGDLVPGRIGVTVFFFISGYLITGLLMGEQQAFGRVDFPKFFGRRMLRLLPELIAMLAVIGLVLAPILHEPLQLGALEAALFYWTNYYIIWGMGTCGHCAVTGPLWSLAVEEHFYLLAPLALGAMAFAPKRMIALFGALIVAALLWRTYAVYGLHLTDVYTYKATECRLDSLAWGCLAAVLQQHSPRVMAFVRRTGPGLFVAGCGLLLSTLLVRDDGFRQTLRYTIQGLALMAIILPLVNHPALSPARRLLELPPMRWMGRRSYGAYLWHYTALNLTALALGLHGAKPFAHLHDRLLAVPLVLTGTWILAGLSYRWVFKPMQRFKPLLAPSRTPAWESATPATSIA